MMYLNLPDTKATHSIAIKQDVAELCLPIGNAQLFIITVVVGLA